MEQSELLFHIEALLSSDNKLRNESVEILYKIGDDLPVQLIDLVSSENLSTSTEMLIINILGSYYIRDYDPEKEILIKFLINKIFKKMPLRLLNCYTRALDKIRVCTSGVKEYLVNTVTEKLPQIHKTHNDYLGCGYIFQLLSLGFECDEKLFPECIEVIETLSDEEPHNTVFIKGLLKYINKVTEKNKHNKNKQVLVSSSAIFCEKIKVLFQRICENERDSVDSLFLILNIITTSNSSDLVRKTKLEIFQIFNKHVVGMKFDSEDGKYRVWDYPLLDTNRFENITNLFLTELEKAPSTVVKEILYKLIGCAYILTVEDINDFEYSPNCFIGNHLKVSLEWRLDSYDTKTSFCDIHILERVSSLNEDIEFPLLYFKELFYSKNDRVFNSALKILSSIIGHLDTATKESILVELWELSNSKDLIKRAFVYEFLWENPDFTNSQGKNFELNLDDPLPLIITTLKMKVTYKEFTQKKFDDIGNLIIQLEKENKSTIHAILLGQLFDRYPEFILQNTSKWIEFFNHCLKFNYSPHCCDYDYIEMLECAAKVVRVQNEPEVVLEINKILGDIIKNGFGNSEMFIDQAVVFLAMDINYRAKSVLNLEYVKYCTAEYSYEYYHTSLLYADAEQWKLIKNRVFDDDEHYLYGLFYALLLTAPAFEVFNFKDIPMNDMDIDSDKFQLIMAGVYKNVKVEENIYEFSANFLSKTTSISIFTIKLGILGLLQLFKNTNNEKCVELMVILCSSLTWKKVDESEYECYFETEWNFKSDQEYLELMKFDFEDTRILEIKKILNYEEKAIAFKKV